MLTHPDFPLLAYDPQTGDFFWLVDRPGVQAGAVAGSRKPDGYSWRITYAHRTMVAHHLAWLFAHGEMPPEGMVVDHKDLNPFNNRIDNLRLATAQQNSANRRPRRDGLKGVARLRSGRYQAQIKVNGKSLYLGSFPTEEEAHCAYMAAAKDHFGVFARGTA